MSSGASAEPVPLCDGWWWGSQAPVLGLQGGVSVSCSFSLTRGHVGFLFFVRWLALVMTAAVIVLGTPHTGAGGCLLCTQRPQRGPTPCSQVPPRTCPRRSLPGASS